MDDDAAAHALLPLFVAFSFSLKAALLLTAALNIVK
jgi:hypothetical protein